MSPIIPESVSRYLWDTPIDQINIQKHATFIIERVLEYGERAAIGWIDEQYGEDAIVDVIKNSKRISPKTANFYATIYGVDPKEVACLQKPSIPKQNRF